MASEATAAAEHEVGANELVKQKHQLFVSLLALSDAVVAAAACYAAWTLRLVELDQRFPEQWREWIRQPLVVPMVPLTLVGLWLFRLYTARRDRSIWAEQAQIVKGCLAAVVGLALGNWLIGGQEVFDWAGRAVKLNLGLGGASMTVEAARWQLGLLAVLMVLMLCLHRLAFRLSLRELRKRGWNLRHVAIIGTGRLGRITCRTLERNSWTGITVAYFIGHRERSRRRELLGRPVLGGLADMEEVLERKKPDAVYIAMPSMVAADLPEVLRRLERFAVDVRIIPDVQPRYVMQSMAVSELDGMPILSYRESPMEGIRGVMKRFIDVVGALVGLIVFAPVMLAVAGLVRLTSPGPVIFKQRRVSLGGEEFSIYKFRTMYCTEDENGLLSGAAEENGPRWTARDDPRVTAVGCWLRRMSLDELPQLFNVLLGEMSLVGPRPERPELIARFKEDWRGYMLRQHVKAGITGWAQVNGLRGDTSLRKRLQHDLFYIRHWSLGFDLKILWLTLFRGFVHRNAH